MKRTFQAIRDPLAQVPVLEERCGDIWIQT